MAADLAFRVFLPAAGYRNNSSLNNAGSNGNYWSSELNSNNSNNAWKLNFNSGNVNTNNNNNRYYGQSVRPVRCSASALTTTHGIRWVHPLLNAMNLFHITRSQLLIDLHQAYHDARRHKRNKSYQRHFEAMAEKNLTELCDELWTRTYKPRPSTCFIINDPKPREVFAAEFRDRIVHHLYFNYVHEMLERTFIQDSYSCIKGRGTHYGIRRLEHHIRQESQNYQERCYVLKLDIRGYFMHINRQLLLEETLHSLHRMATHRVSQSSSVTWQECIDMDFVSYLTREIVMLDPTIDCIRHGAPADWHTLPRDKSLFHSPHGCGLPIGNLTSQLFSNVYLNVFDQWMKRTLKCRHYGRYVDDFYVVSTDRSWLHSLIPHVQAFLQEMLSLQVHGGKTMLCHATQGVQFLGAYLKPHRRYVSNTTLRRVHKKIRLLKATLDRPDGQHLRSSLSSIMGIMRQHRSWRLRRRLVGGTLAVFAQYGCFDDALTKYQPSHYFRSQCAHSSSRICERTLSAH